jgi:hypothetical protein
MRPSKLKTTQKLKKKLLRRLNTCQAKVWMPERKRISPKNGVMGWLKAGLSWW